MSLFMSARAALLAVSTLAVAGPPLAARAAAGGPAQQKHTAKMPQNMAELMRMDPEHCMKMMDQKNKGYVTKEEFMKFQEQLWTNMDKNRDTQVDSTEFGGKPAPGGG
jgi:hypothetical protein